MGLPQGTLHVLPLLDTDQVCQSVQCRGHAFTNNFQLIVYLMGTTLPPKSMWVWCSAATLHSRHGHVSIGTLNPSRTEK